MLKFIIYTPLQQQYHTTMSHHCYKFAAVYTSWAAHTNSRINVWSKGSLPVVDCIWNVMAHAQKPDFVFRRNGLVHLNRPGGHQFSRLLAAEVCESAVVMLDKPCSDVVWRVLATHSIRQFPLHFPSLRHRVPSHFNRAVERQKGHSEGRDINTHTKSYSDRNNW